MGKATSIFVVLTIIVALLAIYIWATIPFEISGITVIGNIKGMDSQGKIVDLTTGQLATISYPSIAKIQIGATATVNIVGMDSAKLKWWADYRIQGKPTVESTYHTYDAWEGGWSTDGGSLTTLNPLQGGWAPYWYPNDVTQWFTVNAGGTFDFEPCKKAYWSNGWKYNHGEGWIPLDPNKYASLGDWIKWSGSAGEEQGWGQTPIGDYNFKVSMHVKVNYEDNYGKEQNAIGPPVITAALGTSIKSGANGELVDILTFAVNFAAGTVTVTITPKLLYTWVPLDMGDNLSPLAINLATFFQSLAIPVWILHIALPVLVIAFGAAAYYSHKKD